MLEQKLTGTLLFIFGCINIYRIAKYKEPFFFFFAFFLRKRKSSPASTIFFAVISMLMIGLGVAFFFSDKRILF